MKPLRLFSVIIPAYRAERTVGEAVASALRTRAPVEVIVVDDASSRPLDRSDLPAGPVRLIRRLTNGGSARSRNDGISACAGDWIAFLDADDLYAPNRLDAVDAFLTSVDADGVMTDTWQAFEDGTRRLIRPKVDASGQIRLGSPAHFTSLVVRRETLLAVGSFDPRWRIQEDSDFWLRLLRHRARIRLLPGAQYVYRIHDQSKVHRAGRAAQAAEFAHIWSRQLLAPGWSLRERATVLHQTLRQITAAGWRAMLRAGVHSGRHINEDTAAE